ncbi:hypothetical protein [Microbacterium rhizomatis]|uniref:DUF916 domain-containing protein n=1 Tax=Microbacterium rhizomatis TaxID=1631477 RepID=A0A5J5J4N7_9MICO|nr:hypothetical protein [Microbacterium rhizomatis]KAA9110980.1 hypothetical protein F6B43_05000 [Microbacterium rhizomatis]
MTAPRRALRRGVLLGALLAAAVLSSLASVGAQAADPPPDEGGGNLSVVITDGSPTTPTPTPSASKPVGAAGNGASSTGATRGTGSSSGAGGSGTGGGGAGATGTTPAGEVSVAGMLYIGGLNSAAALSPSPLEGDVTLWFTVRNASKSTIDATASFWMNSQLFTNRIDTVDAVAITGLQPGETRVVTTQLHHAGQWTVLDAHVTLTPPETVDGTALAPVTRDATVLFFPWLIVGALAIMAIGFLVVRVLRRVVFVPAMMDAA